MPATQYTTDDVLAVFEDRTDYAEPLTATDVADELGCSRRTALNKLEALVENTNLRCKQVGGRAKVYWIPVEM